MPVPSHLRWIALTLPLACSSPGPEPGAPGLPGKGSAAAPTSPGGSNAEASPDASPAPPTGPVSEGMSAAPGSGAIPVFTAPSVAPPPGADAAASAQPEPPDLHRLPGTNLAFRMPGQVVVTDMSYGGPAFLVKGEKGCEAMVTTVKAGLSRSMGQAKEAIQADTIRWRRFTREERSPQGWILEYETDGLNDPKQMAYGFNVRVNAQGAQVACSRVVATREAAQCGVAACLSLTQTP